MPAIGNEPGGHGVQHHVHPLVMPALVAGAQLIIWPRRTLAASGRPPDLKRLSTSQPALRLPLVTGPWNTRFAALRRKSAPGGNLEPALSLWDNPFQRQLCMRAGTLGELRQVLKCVSLHICDSYFLPYNPGLKHWHSSSPFLL